MIKNILGFFTFLFMLPLQAQYIDLTVCNEIEVTEERNNCLRASLENLIVKDLEKNMDMLRLQPGDSVSMNLEVDVNGAGNLRIQSLQTPSIAVARAVETAIYGVKPLEIYKNKAGEVVRAQLNIQTVFTINENGALKALPKNNFTAKRVGHETEIGKEDDVPFAVIEEVPVFPGCKNGATNQERKECMSKGITTYVVSNFDLSTAGTLGLSGRQRIAVQFKIGDDGFVKDVMARAPHPLLEEEAIRVVSSLPKMIPGKQKGENVTVVYSLPIVFAIEEDEKEEKEKRKKKKGRS